MFNAETMTKNLAPATRIQWASRVIDLDKDARRIRMCTKFLEENGQFIDYRNVGRHENEKEATIAEKVDGDDVAITNPDFKHPSGDETRGRRAIEAFVSSRSEYLPRIWLVEPTARTTTP